MVGVTKFSGAAVLAVLAGLAAAHPGESHSSSHMKRELSARDANARLGSRALASCGNSAAAQELKARSIARRAQAVQKLRQKRGVTTPARKNRRELADLQSWEAVEHNKTGSVSYDMFTPLTDVFDGNTSCILSPEITAGPYYVVGEKMRSNVIESEYCDGVELFLEVQYVDINTCAPVPSVAVDIWNCNATGVYSGVESGQAGFDTTFLRGIQLTDSEGVVSFETIFPGHYSGRATHTHLLSHINATLETNGTISVWDAPVSHMGQLFWPEDLITEVEALAPYNTNTVDRTTNEEDMWSVLQADASYDPFPQYVFLGSDISDGLFAWMQIGINVSADYTADDYYSIAAYYGEDGGHAYEGSKFAGGGGGEAPSGGFSGTPPTGAAPTATASA
ncbi:aromatic compound dioxygenase [Thozetella sp. PMI_491]|nr:aromatic compound dioxygenase [Thozetella sp. PMI_491]